MKIDSVCYLAAAVLASAAVLMPAQTRARQYFSINFPENAEHCADANVRAAGQVARASETFTLQPAELATLEVNAESRGNIRVRGWDRPDYSVEACRIAAASDKNAADQLLQRISVNHAGGRFSASGPAGEEDWLVIFVVHAPRGASLDLEAKNGPISVRDISGTVKARAVNGPLSFAGCSGALDAHTTNGPISFSGGGGDVRLRAENGPISLKIAGEEWNGPQLDARTVNGPLSASLSQSFRTSIRVESTGHGPMSCRLDACRSARTEETGNKRILELNGSSATIRLSTGNGPVSVGASRARGTVI